MPAPALRISGFDQLRAVIKKLGDVAATAGAAAIYREAERIMTDSKQNYVPVAPDGGTLKASGVVALPEHKGNTITVVMGYGGAAAAYALAVHEHLSAHSPPSWIAAEDSGSGVHWHLSGRGPKYLEKPFNEARKGMDARLAEDVRREIARAAK